MSKFIMMIGLPASGKSTYAKELSVKENAIIHSSDSLREELFGDVGECDKNDILFKELHNRIKNDLKNNKNVIWDSTNISYKKRKAFIDEIKKINCEKICYLIATPYDKCLEQNKNRERNVPEYVIKKMYLNFYVPQYYEGWDFINIVYNFNKEEFNYQNLFHRLEKISQDNPHHTLSIGWHCLKCASNIYGKGDEILYEAALFHDIGKEFTKSFINSKGEETAIAHYYQHDLVSAYDSLFYLYNNINLPEIIQLITWHMKPFFLETERSKNKFIKLVGQDFYDKLLILHEADKMAK